MPLSKIVADIKRKGDNALNQASKEIGEKISKGLHTAIHSFYSIYKPESYSRTYNLYTIGKGVGGKGIFSKRVGLLEYDCGLYIGAEYMEGDYYKNPPHGWTMSKADVFNRAYNEGIHGFTKDDLTGWWYPKVIPPKTTPIVTMFEKTSSRYLKGHNIAIIVNKYLRAAGFGN